MLAATALLTALLTLPYGLAMWTLWPMRAILGNRNEPPPPLPAWGERAQRAQRNMLENFPPFAALVLVAHAAGLANQDTALGATIFFWARLAHAIVYIVGIWRLRALAFFAGLAGQSLMARLDSSPRDRHPVSDCRRDRFGRFLAAQACVGRRIKLHEQRTWRRTRPVSTSRSRHPPSPKRWQSPTPTHG
jgi:uncharacterized MAPEG superfamily protein